MKELKISEPELERIRKAVSSAEGATSGEIVPFLVKASDEYEETGFKSAILFILSPLFVLAILSLAWLLPFHITILEIVLGAIGMGILGYIMPYLIPTYKRMLLSQNRLQNAVEHRALSAFLEQEVFSTENRTGILIFISRFEHMVEVIGDKGINEKVDAGAWEEVVNIIIAGIKKDDPVGGITRGIEKCGELLAAAGVHKPPDNPNELPDNLRME